MKVSVLLERFEARTLRERALIALTALVVLYTAWHVLLMGPLNAHQEALSAEMQRLQSSIAQLDAQIQRHAQGEGPAALQAQRERLERERRTRAQLEQRLQAQMGGLVDPVQMARLVEEVLNRQSDLTLLSLKSLPVRALHETGKGRVFRHGLTVELEGSYLGALRYVRALEALPWGFQWEAVELQVQEHPRTRVRITLHTLSLREGWIGA